MALPNLAGVLMDPMNLESCEVLGVAVTESSGGSPLGMDVKQMFSGGPARPVPNSFFFFC
jgi:hypothetical protein